MRSGDLYRLDWNSLEREIEEINEQFCSFCLLSLKQFLFYSPLSTLNKRKQSPTTPIAPIPPTPKGYSRYNFSSFLQTAPLFWPASSKPQPPFLLNTVPPKLQLSHFILRTQNTEIYSARSPKQFPIAAKREFPQRKWRTCTATAPPIGAVIGSETPPLSLRAAFWFAAAAWGCIAIGWDEFGAAVAPFVGLICCCCCCCWCCCWRCCSCCLATTNRLLRASIAFIFCCFSRACCCCCCI